MQNPELRCPKAEYALIRNEFKWHHVGVLMKNDLIAITHAHSVLMKMLYLVKITCYNNFTLQALQLQHL